MGTHILNVGGSLYKSRIDHMDQFIDKDIVSIGSQADIAEYEIAKKQIKNKEGCNIHGDIFVKKVPGNFHISSHAYGPTVSRLASEGLYTFDLSHRINHFSVGDHSDFRYISETFSEDISHLSPLDSVTKDDLEKKVYEYYMKVLNLSY